MSGNEEQSVECPLCMEPLEMDDINFFPCTCGYQICRFCWHRIRTDENGLCPACRKQYPEDPADFKPLTQEELQKIKTEKRQKDILRKQKLSENRKHLANVRVVQKNLVFVVGLSQRLADPEVLKKQEYFGKFGKIHKVVINHSTSYAGSQGPSASAYVTYHRAEDALRAIQAVNNIHVDGRTLKASLGTTKYCSHFLKGQQCPKPDCMYLHELGDEAASFTKEEMQQGKHQEYERKLHEHLFSSVQNHHVEKPKDGNPRRQAASPTQILPLNTNSKDAWPSLQSHGTNNPNKDTWQKQQSGTQSFRPELTLGNNSSSSGSNSSNSSTRNCAAAGEDYRSLGMRNKEKCESSHHRSQLSPTQNSMATTTHTRNSPPPQLQSLSAYHSVNHSQMSAGPPQSRHSPTNSKNSIVNNSTAVSTVKQQEFCPTTSTAPGSHNMANYLSCQTQDRNCFDTNTESNSFFSNGNALPPRTTYDVDSSVPEWLNSSSSESSLFTSETLPVQSTTDWQAAFGFGPSNDDELGFDPWDESAKALADLMEKESRNNSHPHQHYNNVSKAGILNHSSLVNRTSTNNIDHCQNHNLQPRRLGAPPGFSSNHVNSFYRNPLPRSSLATGDNKAFLMNLAQRNSISTNGPTSFLSDIQMLPNLGYNNHTKDVPGNHAKGLDSFNMKGWHEGLRALIPNFNINSGAFNYSHSPLPNSSHQSKTSWNPNPQISSNVSWQSQDPTVVSTDRSDSPPHWMRSLQQLTEIDPPAVYNNHRLPFTTQFTYRHL